MKKSHLLLCGSVALSSTLMSSCGIFGLSKHIEKMEQHGAVILQVEPAPKGNAPTYALAWRMENGKRKDSAGFQRLRADGVASFTLDLNHTYRIGAFTDENGNGAYDEGEPLAVQPEVQPRALGDPSVKPKIWKLTLSRQHGLEKGTVIQLPKENKELGGKLNLAVGDVVSIDDKRFAADEGGGGLWRPLDFLSSNTLGLYFTEPYDPKRIPVVFVYGIGGSPQDWRYFMENFDHKRHQLWFFHYPSGMRLDRVSGVLAQELVELKKRHGFRRCDVVAHSMGGLVARSAIAKAVTLSGDNFIPKFVSISTPWGGHKAAASGIRHLKKPVPSWLDVVPGSDFLLSLYATPLPRGTTHDLIYGSIDGGPFWMKEKNDGVVTVESETDLRIKKSTSSFRHLFHEHVDILNSPETVTAVANALK